MPTDETRDATERRESASALRVRIAAAHTAVSASKVTGRPVDPRVQALADANPKPPRFVKSRWRRVLDRCRGR